MRFYIRLVATGLVLTVAGGATSLAQEAPVEDDLRVRNVSTTDHTKLKALQRTFSSGPEVTETCLQCHTEVGEQAMHSVHFQWSYDHPSTGQTLGKRHLINSFCGSVAGNEPRCTSCHAGYGWQDMNQPPPDDATAVDCLACHADPNLYTKTATGAGHPPLAPVRQGTKTITGAEAVAIDLTRAAQSVRMPTRDNCGACHFYGGGGDNVKHGDLSSALVAPNASTDVHMAADGLNFTCSTCHVEMGHNWAGSRYNMMARDEGGTGKPGLQRYAASCESCHSAEPHAAGLVGMKLNEHTDKVACQTCHIPDYARGGVATKSYWDWSTAGQLDAAGQAFAKDEYTQTDGKHRHTYLSTKGDFAWAENVVPHYEWFDGAVDYTFGNEEIDPGQVVPINTIKGDSAAGDSRIWPFKVMEGRQAYDSVNNTLVHTHVWGPATDTAFWTNFDWDKAIEAGMRAAGRSDEYSGQFGFVDTQMHWPITHMVAPADEALACEACHTTNGRLENVAGVFMPGTGHNHLVGLLGKLMVLAVMLGIAGHIVLRVFVGNRAGGEHG